MKNYNNYNISRDLFLMTVTEEVAQRNYLKGGR